MDTESKYKNRAVDTEAGHRSLEISVKCGSMSDIMLGRESREIVGEHRAYGVDTELFSLAVAAALRIPTSGIGTLSEKRVHAALKYYVQPDMKKHEVKICGFVSDALSEDGVFEIQTGAFRRLSGKLDVLLKSGTVTVVYPVICEKTLYTTDTDTGETSVRKSPKKRTVYNVFSELYALRRFLPSTNLRLRLITLKADEHRAVRTHVSKAGKKRALTVSSDLIPTVICDDVTLCSYTDYLNLLPSDLPDVFTSSDLSYRLKISRSLSSTMLLILTDLSVVERIGKSGRSYLYRVTPK